MTTTWEAITNSTYASADWRYVIEHRGDEWHVIDRGVLVRVLPSLDMARAWVDGKVIR